MLKKAKKDCPLVKHMLQSFSVIICIKLKFAFKQTDNKVEKNIMSANWSKNICVIYLL